MVIAKWTRAKLLLIPIIHAPPTDVKSDLSISLQCEANKENRSQVEGAIKLWANWQASDPGNDLLESLMKPEWVNYGQKNRDEKKSEMRVFL